MQRLYKSRARRERGRPKIKRSDAEAIQIKGSQREERGDNKKLDAEAIQIKCSQSAEKGDNKERGCRAYTNQGPAEGREGRQ